MLASRNAVLQHMFLRTLSSIRKRVRARNVLFVALILLLLSAAALWLRWTSFHLLPYHPSMYSGDGVLTDAGYRSYPRYMISLPSCSLATPGSHFYTIENAPSCDYGFGLRVLSTFADGKRLQREELDPLRKSMDTFVALLGFKWVTATG